MNQTAYLMGTAASTQDFYVICTQSSQDCVSLIMNLEYAISWIWIWCLKVLLSWDWKYTPRSLWSCPFLFKYWVFIPVSGARIATCHINWCWCLLYRTSLDLSQRRSFPSRLTRPKKDYRSTGQWHSYLACPCSCFVPVWSSSEPYRLVFWIWSWALVWTCDFWPGLACFTDCTFCYHLALIFSMICWSWFPYFTSMSF